MLDDYPCLQCYRAQLQQLCLFASLAQHTFPGEKNNNWPSAVQTLVAKGSDAVIRLIRVVFPLFADLYDVLTCLQDIRGSTSALLFRRRCESSSSLCGSKERVHTLSTSDSVFFSAKQPFVPSRLSTEASPVLYPKMARVRPIGTQRRGIRCSCAYGLLTLLRAQQHEQCLRCQY